MLIEVVIHFCLLPDENGRVSYQIAGGNRDQFFKINEDTGLVTINRRVDSDNLNTSRINLNVTAYDHGECDLWDSGITQW